MVISIDTEKEFDEINNSPMIKKKKNQQITDKRKVSQPDDGNL